jgi:heat shock protein HtpX
MSKRIVLFLATNLAILVVLAVIWSLLGLGGFIGPEDQILLAPLALFSLFWGMGGAFISLQLSRWVAKKAVGVHLIDGRTGHADLDWVYNTVANQARQANLPMPEVGVYESGEVNAFATGPSRKRSLVAVSTGLLNAMSREEAEAVLAHEVAHIKNGDMVTMTLIQGVINAFVIFFARLVAFAVRQVLDPRIAWVASFAVLIALHIILGFLGSMITAWFSRQREFRADAGGAAIAGREKMVAALRRLMRTQEAVDTSQQALAAFKISGKRGWAAAFSTHPPLEDRIAALERGR